MDRNVPGKSINAPTVKRAIVYLDPADYRKLAHKLAKRKYGSRTVSGWFREKVEEELKGLK